jgi:hypothetical protein
MKTKRSQSADPPQMPRAPGCRLRRRGRGCADLRLVRPRGIDPSLQPPCGPPAIAGKLASLLNAVPKIPPHGCQKEGNNDHGGSRICEGKDRPTTHLMAVRRCTRPGRNTAGRLISATRREIPSRSEPRRCVVPSVLTGAWPKTTAFSFASWSIG